MKKFLLLIGLAIWVNMIFAQTATITIGTVNDPAPGPVTVPVTLDAIFNPNGPSLVSGFALYFYYDATVCTGTPVIAFDPFWVGTTVGNTIIDQPVPGLNTVAIVYATGGVIDVTTLPQSIANVTFNYAAGGTDLSWTEFKLKGEGADVKTVSYMFDYDGYEYALNTIPGFVGSAATPGKVWNGTIETFAGSGYGDWMEADNWTPPGSPTATDDVTIPVTPYNPILNFYGIRECNMLTIDLGATLTLGGGGYLTTHGDFTNEGTFVIGSELFFGSTATGSIITEMAVLGAGTFEFDRFVDCTGTIGGVANDIGWHYISSPWDGFTTDALPNYFTNAWNQGTGMWMHYAMDPITNPCEAWPATTLMGAEAWSINADLDYPNVECPLSPPTTGTTIEFIATGAANVHNAPYSQSLGYGAGANQEFNLVGNPFPASLDFNGVVWGPNTMQYAAVWFGCDANYQYWTPAVPGLAVGVGQGFFAQTTGAGGSIDFSAARTHGYNAWKTDLTNLLTLTATGNDKVDRLHVRFMEDMTAGVDMNGDGPKLISTSEGLPQIYTTASGEKLAINALPETPVVPMGFTSVTSGEYTIEAIETSEFANVVLEDRTTGEQTDLLTGSYTFNYTVGDDADRFFIHFTPLGIGDNLAASINIWSNDHKIYVQSPDISGDIVVFNMMGQEVIRTEIEPGLNTIPVNDGNAYYVVKVISSDVAKTGKVYVK